MGGVGREKRLRDWVCLPVAFWMSSGHVSSFKSKPARPGLDAAGACFHPGTGRRPGRVASGEACRNIPGGKDDLVQVFTVARRDFAFENFGIFLVLFEFLLYKSIITFKIVNLFNKATRLMPIVMLKNCNNQLRN